MSIETAPPRTSSEPAPGAIVSLPPAPRQWTSLGRAFVQTARRLRGKRAVLDSLGTSLTYGDLLIRSLVLGRVLRREVGDSRYVGIMVPPTVAGSVTNIALTLHGLIPVNLNYTTGQEVLDSSVHQCRMSHVVTSRRALDKFPCRPPAELLLLEDIPRKVTTKDKVWSALVARALPLGFLGTALPGARGDHRGETATVIFTSGSTGDPKGVVLTHGNVLANVHQIESQVHLIPDEVILGVLPFFHSFGYTVTLWTSLLLGKTSVFHVNPQDARIVGNLIQEHRVTMLAASPTFMRFYLKKCDRDQFATVRLPILGAEKLKPELARELRSKLGIEPLEGYGCTETGPVVAVNTPHPMTTAKGRTVDGNRPGTVGLPVPGTEIKTTDPDTGTDLPRGAEGIIHVRGPQVMKGYLDQPSRTSDVLRDGWYNTGDIGKVDEDGFLSITGRISRFSKIGGEMVPHERVESAILSIVDDEDLHLAVTSVPCPRRGERLIVVHNELSLPPDQICKLLGQSSLPKLWLPSPEDFVYAAEIPILGTGKVDLKAVRRLAEENINTR